MLSVKIQPTDKALAYETRRWDACGRVCITYATVAQVVRASASYSEGQWFKSTLWHHKQKFDFLKNFCYNIYVEKIKKQFLHK